MDDTLDPTPADHQLVASGLAARLERLPRTTRSHRGWIVLLGALFICDLMDTNGLAYVAPAIRADWGLTVAQIGQLTSYSFLGMFAGGIVFGRRPPLLPDFLDDDVSAEVRVPAIKRLLMVRAVEIEHHATA